MNTTTKETIKNAFLAIEAGAEMTSSVKIQEFRYITTNKDTLSALDASIGKKIYALKSECHGGLSDFKLKYNLVADNDSFLVTFWVEIFPKNGAKSAKVSENPGKTPEVGKNTTTLWEVMERHVQSRNRDYFSAPINTKNYYLNNFPSCAGMIIETV